MRRGSALAWSDRALPHEHPPPSPSSSPSPAPWSDRARPHTRGARLGLRAGRRGRRVWDACRARSRREAEVVRGSRRLPCRRSAASRPAARGGDGASPLRSRGSEIGRDRSAGATARPRSCSLRLSLAASASSLELAPSCALVARRSASSLELARRLPPRRRAGEPPPPLSTPECGSPSLTLTLTPPLLSTPECGSPSNLNLNPPPLSTPECGSPSRGRVSPRGRAPWGAASASSARW